MTLCCFEKGGGINEFMWTDDNRLCTFGHSEPEGEVVFEVIPIALMDALDSTFKRFASSREPVRPSER